VPPRRCAEWPRRPEAKVARASAHVQPVSKGARRIFPLRWLAARACFHLRGVQQACWHKVTVFGDLEDHSSLRWVGGKGAGGKQREEVVAPLRARRVAVRGARAKKTRGEGMGVTALLAQINRRCAGRAVVAPALRERAPRALLQPPKVTPDGTAQMRWRVHENISRSGVGIPIAEAGVYHTTYHLRVRVSDSGEARKA